MKLVLQRRNASFKRSATTGVTKIKRDGYSTVNGFSKANEWWRISAEVRKRDNNQCVPCKNKGLKIKASEVHHIVPLSRGGKTVMSNLMTVCDNCHDKFHAGHKQHLQAHREHRRSK